MQTIRRPIVSFVGVLVLGLVMAVAIAAAGSPGLAWLGVGAVLLAAFAIGGSLGDGLRAFGVMVVVAAVFAMGRRSDTVAALSGPGRDERWSQIDLRSTAFAGTVLFVVLAVEWLVEITDGDDGQPFIRLLAVGGVAYVAALAWGRWWG